MKTEIKLIRIPFQIIALLLHTYFVFKTTEAFLNKTGEDALFSMLFTLLIVIACEVVSFIDIILFVISKHNIYSYINLSHGTLRRVVLQPHYCLRNCSYAPLYYTSVALQNPYRYIHCHLYTLYIYRPHSLYWL